MAVAAREWDRICSRRLYFCLGLALPLLTFAFFTALFSRGIIADLPVAVVDRDHSALSRTFIRMVDASQGVAVVAQMADLEEGRRAIVQGRIHGLLVLPENMERDVFRGQGASPAFYYNNQLFLVGGILQRTLGKVGGTLSAGIDFKRRMKTGDSRDGAKVHLEPVGVDVHTLFNPYLNYTHYLYLALLPSMLMIFACCLTTHALCSEIKAGSCGQWLDCAGGSALTALVGKLLPHTLMLVICGGIMFLLNFKVLSIPLVGSGMFILGATLVYILACQMICVFIFALVKNMDKAVAMSSVYSGSAFAFAGITFPALGMPKLAQGYSALLPLSHFMRILQDQALRGADLGYSMPGLNQLLAFVLVPGLLGLVLTRLPGGVFHGKGADHV